METNSINSEIANKIPVNFIFLPHCKEEEQRNMANLWGKFNADTLVRNMGSIETIDVSDKNEQQQIWWNSVKTNLNNQFDRFKDHLDEFQNARSVEDTLGIIKPNEEIEYPDLVRQIKENYDQAKGNLILLSDSHISTASAIEALNQQGIGLIVFDRHVDIYKTYLELLNEMDNGEKTRLGKRNFITYLLDNHKLEAVAVIGVPQAHAQEIKDGGNNTKNPNDATPQEYDRLKDRLFIADEGNYIDKNGYANYVNFLGEVQRQIEFFKAKGVKNIIFSIDTDVLQADQYPYTTMEYNPLYLLLYLGSLDLKSLLDEGQGGQVFDMFAKVTSSLSSDLKLKGISGTGLPIGLIGQAIKTLGKNNIPIGVDIPSGGKFYGDIVELSAKDYGGVTAKAVKGLAQIMVRT